MTIYLPPLDDNDPELFPPVSSALDDPDGLLAIGGDLSPQRLRAAYEHGIFPWFGNEEPYLWWSPSERAVIDPTTFVPSKSLRKFARKQGFRVSINHRFDDVIEQCALIRGAHQVWITHEMREAYKKLHRLGGAHSVEVWQGDTLVGGLYGVGIGGLFCGESMFSLQTNASKTALWRFCEHFKQHGGRLIDCQMMTEHLASLGAQPLPRADFIQRLNQLKHRITDATLFQSQWISGDLNGQ
ncbi:leucyl/phenylalanyl-tRNA--protein transferase [Enterovibrio norvegicus FF-33]|uniref:Leucyl/phenylalanyl-tRNA--protein transferase n=1 Tax=Enterovibrio norvegicus FF-454 TaxID=1185651 RepID=A0A1E5C2N0_9GAMM|nr:leucyl/phenylalanyl-tRNA--protein transferase [Enterovibrio norvegicus]OEE59764.1 leucyl/phenylalanyl-tRNA--protein transferase [Enterovibrio norvegicus FF-454]OEE70168.1 leucyl/phenylalanyl-tRNA--protein transferase [Enterovibrio norvegicus FF-33]OEE89999.1 leucyl/phenylalanyl-tRNA--protein transferase [Enterovibrio norvegicus FF-162]